MTWRCESCTDTDGGPQQNGLPVQALTMSAALASSVHFILVTPCPATVLPFAYGYFSFKDLAKLGIVVTLVGAVFISIGMWVAAMTWRYVIARKLFGLFLDLRPPSDKSPVKEVAAAIVTFIRAMDRTNGVFGFGAVAKAAMHFDEVGSVIETQRDGKPCVIFEPSGALADFRFDLWEDHLDGTIGFTVQGDRRYDGFFLSGDLTSGSRDVRADWPTPSLSVSARTDALHSATRNAQRLRDVFVTDHGAKDYASWLKRP